MFKAEKNSRMPGGGEVSAWSSLLVRSTSPLVKFVIGLATVRNLNLVVKSTPKSEKNLQRAAK